MNNSPSNISVPTIEQVWRDYRRTRKITMSTVKSYDFCLTARLSDWLTLPMSSISKKDIEERHSFITKNSGPGAANLTLRVLKALFFYAQSRYDNEQGEPLIKSNPVMILNNNGWNREPPRKTYIHQDHYHAWYEGVKAVRSETAHDYFLFVAFTGCRRSEAANLRWDDVSFEFRQVTFKNTKNHNDHTLPVCALIMSILTRRLKGRAGAVFVFGSSKSVPLTGTQRYERQVDKVFGQRWCLHDLRRTYATLAHAYNMDMLSIKRLLNHTDRDITWRYIVHDPERYRKEVEGMGLFLMQLMGISQIESVYQASLIEPPKKRPVLLTQLDDFQYWKPRQPSTAKKPRSIVSLLKSWHDFKLESDHRVSTLETWEETFRNCFHPWRNRSLSSITTVQLECLHRDLTIQFGQSTADFALVILEEVYEFALRSYLDENHEPIFKKNPVLMLVKELTPVIAEKQKQSHLQPHQIKKFVMAVELVSESQTAKDYLMFLLFTGIQPRKAGTLEWRGIDYEDDSILLQDEKVHLHPWLSKRFLRRQEIALGREFVFSAKSDSSYVLPEMIRARIAKKCEIPFDSITISKTFHMMAATMGFKQVHAESEYRIVQDAIFRHIEPIEQAKQALDENHRSQSSPMFRYPLNL